MCAYLFIFILWAGLLPLSLVTRFYLFFGFVVSRT